MTFLLPPDIKGLNLILLTSFLSAFDLAWQACSKKTNIELELINLDMLLIVEKGTRSGMCYAIHRHAKTNNYMKDYDPNHSHKK